LSNELRPQPCLVQACRPSQQDVITIGFVGTIIFFPTISVTTSRPATSSAGRLYLFVDWPVIGMVRLDGIYGLA
ncbi:MAG: hypothetical protein V4689_15345, partial [Verrucomicrobiota bacterium]